MTRIKVGNVMTAEAGDNLAKVFQGQTYMDLQAGVAPAGGSFDVWVSTQRSNTSKSELQGMVIHLLAESILKQIREQSPRLQNDSPIPGGAT